MRFDIRRIIKIQRVTDRPTSRQWNAELRPSTGKELPSRVAEENEEVASNDWNLCSHESIGRHAYVVGGKVLRKNVVLWR